MDLSSPLDMAIARWPELADLRRLEGWSWMNGSGQLIGEQRLGGPWLNALVVHGPDDAYAVRLREDEIVWLDEGTVAKVLGGLSGVPLPNQPGAPMAARPLVVLPVADESRCRKTVGGVDTGATENLSRGDERAMSSSDEEQIREVVTASEAAMKDGDAQRLIDRYTEDVVKFDLAPPLRHGGEHARNVERQREWFGTFDGPVDFRVTDLEIEIGGNLAFAYSLNRMSATPKGTDFAFELWYRATYCLRRTDKGWLIAHEHSSTPFYMDGSLRAATDLKP